MHSEKFPDRHPVQLGHEAEFANRICVACGPPADGLMGDLEQVAHPLTFEEEVSPQPFDNVLVEFVHVGRGRGV